jgi:hypothetical protein
VAPFKKPADKGFPAVIDVIIGETILRVATVEPNAGSTVIMVSYESIIHEIIDALSAKRKKEYDLFAIALLSLASMPRKVAII